MKFCNLMAIWLIMLPLSASAEDAKFYWNDGTRLEFPEAGFTTKINMLIQPRYDFTDTDGGAESNSFQIKRARLILSGTFQNDFSYQVENDFVNDLSLLNAYLAWKPENIAEFKIGQFKTLLSRQFNTSDALLQFPDRSFVSDYFSQGRNQGLATTKDLADGRFKLSAAAFNGRSDGEGINREGLDTEVSAMLSARWNAFGKMNAFEEGDVTTTPEAALSTGIAYAFADASNDLDGPTGPGGLVGNDLSTINADITFKHQGLSVASEIFWSDFSSDSAAEANPLGVYAQAGYFVVPAVWELAGRYGIVQCDDGQAIGRCAGKDDIQELTLGLNHYWSKHNLKAQIAYSRLEVDPVSGDNLKTNKAILQLTGYF
ncbi:hypothetical protein JNK13_09510 [bacterium]|nr:hypothetical protein [bacterium]